MIIFLSSLSIAVLALTLFFAIFRGLDKADKKSALYFLPIFAVGFLLYMVALTETGTETFWARLLHAFSSSIRMFSAYADSGAISKLAGQYPVFGVAISLAYFMSVICSAYVLVCFFGRNLLNFIKLHRSYSKNRYIIVGDTKQSKTFAADLRKKHSDCKIILIDSGISKERKKTLMRDGFIVVSGGISADILKKAGIKDTRKKVVLVSFCESDEKNLDVGYKVTGVIREIIDRKIRKITIRESRKQITPDTEKIAKQVKSGLAVSANIMYSNVERAVHFKFAEDAFGKVRFFNVNDIVARRFIFDYPITKYLPRGFFNENDAVIKPDKKILNLFVGFGISNKQLMKKCIRNNQLLGHDYNTIAMEHNPDVLDIVVNTKQHELKNYSVGLFKGGLELDKTKSYLPDPVEKCNIEISTCNVLIPGFYDKVKELVNKFDFSQIVISLDNDKLTMETALEIRFKLNQIGVLNKVKIFANIKEKKEFANDKDLNKDFENDNLGRLTFFGLDSETFTEAVVINQELDIIAKKISGIYSRSVTKNSAGQNAQAFINSTEAEDGWNLMGSFTQDSNRYAAYGIKVKLNLLGFDLERDKEGISEGDYEKIYFSGSEKQLKDKFSPNEYCEIFERDSNNIISNTKRNNLARLEHMRWNAFHIVSGWTKLPIEDITAGADNVVRKIVKTKQHACITTFEGLDKLTKISIDKMKAASGTQMLSDSQMLSVAESIRFDYHLMDTLFDILNGTSYSVVKKN